MSATTSPSKDKGWVKFDETDGADPAGGGGLQTSTRSSSGVSSARGSVNSAVAAMEEDDHSGVLPVSEIQIVDEQNLKRKNSEMASDPPPMFRQMSSATASPIKNGPTAEAAMQNVNLSDDGSSPSKSASEAIRGRRFGKQLSC